MDNILDVICIESEKIKGKGEDSLAFYFSNPDIHYIGVYDGCGGAGAKKYSLLDNKTGAYIASRYAAYLVGNAYEKNIMHNSYEKISDVLHDELETMFIKLNSKLDNGSGLKIGGTMVKTFPTTASIVFIKNTGYKDKIKCNYIWAGDSRGYFLNSSGMHQVTTDDLNSDEDAFTNLYNDGSLSNVICADKKFELHSKILEHEMPVIIISATDGSFGYYSTPMEFEYSILKTLFDSANIDEWENNLKEYVCERAGDDVSMLLALYGFKSFNDIKLYFNERYNYLYEHYMKIVFNENTTTDELYELWSEYKNEYSKEI